MMTTLRWGGVIVVLLLGLTACAARTEVPVQPTPAPVLAPGLSQEAWSAGAIQIVASGNNVVFEGQAYLAVDPISPSGFSVFTIQHVIAGFVDVSIHLPWLKTISTKTNQFFCIRIDPDDRSCGYYMEEMYYTDEMPVIPFERIRQPPQLEVGVYVASPRPDTQKWTVYQVTSIDQDSIQAEAVFDITGGEAVPFGNFCRGRSGGPAVIGRFENDLFEPFISEAGYPIVVGELERGIGDQHPDYIDPLNVCYFAVSINRVVDE